MKTKERPYERVAEGLRKRIAAGEWQPGEMIPARRILAVEYGVAVATLERAAGALIGEGLLSASDRRGTFVAHTRDKVASNSVPPQVVSGSIREPLQGTVGIMAGVIPYDTPELRQNQWSVQILSVLEHGLSTERHLTQRFVNLSCMGQPDLDPAQVAEQLLSHGVNALIVIGAFELEGVIPLCEVAGVPLVSLEYDPVPFAVPQVYVDNAAGGILAARHLRDRGYVELTYLRPFSAQWVEARLSGARAALGHDHLRVIPAEINRSFPESGEGQIEAGYALGCDLLKAGFTPGTGVIAPNDSVALGFMRAATEHGLVPGKDYGIVGFDDWNREAHLTSLRPPLDQIGEEGARLVLRLLRGESSATRIALQHRLIARSSTSKIV